MLTSIALLFLVGLLLSYVFQRLHLPSLLGYLLTGILLGPYVLDWLHTDLLNISVDLRRIALVLILMRAGLALNIQELKQVGRPALLMSFIPASLEIAGVMLLAPRLLGVSLLDAAIMGAVIAAVSPAVIVPKMLHLLENKIGTRKSIPQMIMAAGSVDDVYVIVLFSAFTSMATGGDVSLGRIAEVPVSIVSGLLLGIAVGAALVFYFRHFHMRDSVKLILLMSAAFLFLALENQLKDLFPVAGLLAVMSMGATVLALYPVLAKRLSPKFSKLWVAAEVLLFVLVGATVDLSFAVQAGFGPLWLILGVLVFRMLGVVLSLLFTQLNARERLFCALAYIPKATVQAAIGSLPLSMGLACGNIVLTVAVLSILITAPLGAFAIEQTYKRLLD
ncbi:MAG: cation:proton antiporter [Bacteroidales bacterium]|jgi:NhaP-type Na+/H+ or K+/H+ antiporter|nr:cation:proton antiporter [Bacteroidales bacterium]MDD4770328.1 cation:proton antiporter [Bacteroidales bacterium]HKL92096.1 cation:proton antiporter [Bacteroidales bacterium]